MGSEEVRTENAETRKRGGKAKWIVGALLMLFAAAAAMNLPRGYSDDLTRIGKGKAAVVLVRDKNAVQTFDLLEAMGSVRGEFGGNVEFLLTDFNTPQGRAFMEENNTTKATLVLLDGNGKLIKILRAPQTAGSLKQEISDSFGVNP